MLVVPADAEVNVLTGTEHLHDLTLFRRPSRQPVDLDGVAGSCNSCCDGLAHNSPPWGTRIAPPSRSRRIRVPPGLRVANYGPDAHASSGLSFAHASVALSGRHP
jgi:hypothetical protein